MRRGVKAFEGSNPSDQLGWLVLRVIAELSPCTKTSLITYVAAGDSNSAVGHTTFNPHTRELFCNALLKLKGLAFVRFDHEQIAITDEGRRFLGELPDVALRLDDRSTETSEFRSDTIGEINRTLQTHTWTHYVALLRRFATFLAKYAPRFLARYAPRLKRFCQDRLAGTRVVMQRGFPTIGVRAPDIALEVWTRATTLVHIRARLARMCRGCLEAGAIVNWRTQSGTMLWKAGKARCLSLNAKLAGLSRMVIFAGALLLVALSTGGGVAFLSGKRAENSQETPIVSSRESPIGWFYDGQDHPNRSIFVTRKLSGATWIEGISIRGENTSNQTLTAVEGIIKPDIGQEIKLRVSAAESQQTHDVLSGSEFILEYGFHPDASGQQAGVPAEEFLSKNGGMIFKFSYTVAGVQTTLIEYFSPLRLRTQLVDAERLSAANSP